MRHRFIAVEKAEYPVALMSRILQVSRSGFYAWSKRAESARVRSDRALVVDIKAVHKLSRSIYGSPRVYRELLAQGHTVGRDRVARLMREHNLRGKRKRRFRNTTQSNHRHPVAPNVLERQFTVEQPNTGWVGDITYIWTLEGWLYLSVILDLYSRRVVGWAMNKHIDQALTLRALGMAINACEPGPGLIHHTDRGSQYAANDYQKMLKARGITCSMSRKGNCWDNGVPRTLGRRCSERDESVASRILVAGPGSKLRRAAEVKSFGSERRRKRRPRDVKCEIERRTQVNH